MICYSSIRTLLIDRARLIDALKLLGFTVEAYPHRLIARSGDLVSYFERSSEGQSFSVTGNTDRLIDVNRKYAEIGVRDWAKRNGFTGSVENNGKRIVLQNRRG